MSMHSNHHPGDFTRNDDGTMWPALWVAAIFAVVGALAWFAS